MLSRFLPFAKAFEPFVNTFSVHGFPHIRLHQHFRSGFHQFVAELNVCTLLHCAVTLPLTVTTFNWPQSVYTAGHMQSMLCVDSPHVSEEPCACAHTYAKLPFRHHSPNLLYTPYTYFIYMDNSVHISDSEGVMQIV